MSAKSSYNQREQYWELVDDYPAEVYSLWHHEASAKVISERIADYAPCRGAAVDFGCGPGFWLPSLEKASETFGIDFSAHMLRLARENNSRRVKLVHADMSELQFQSYFEFGICLNALMPEGHSDAIHKIRSLTRSMALGGKIVIVVFALESHLTFLNMRHVERAIDGEESESIDEIMTKFEYYYNNPLGYIRERNGQINKFWLKEELEGFFGIAGGIQICEYFKVPREYDVSLFTPWFHGWVIERCS